MNKNNLQFKLIFLAIICCGFFGWAESSWAANWYVRPSGGSGAGTSWTAAWNGLSAINWSSVSCGDTVWVAGGDYTESLNIQKKCNYDSQLYIRRARNDSSQCTDATGWDPNYDSTIHQINNGIVINGDYDYIFVSGRTEASGDSHGWHIDFTNVTSGSAIEFFNGADADENTFEYLDMQGPGQINYTGSGRALDITPFASPNICAGNTFSHLKIWDWESGAYNVWADNSTYEYIEMFDIQPENWITWHPNGIFIGSSDGGVVRYSKFYKGPKGMAVGEGVFFQGTGMNDWEIYGNIFYDLDSSNLKAIEVKENITNLKIWNNVFDNVMNVVYGSAQCGAGSEFKNNLMYNSNSGSCGTTSYNLDIDIPDPFINQATHDYRIISTIGVNYPRNAGTDLSAYFTTDADGIAFGADGTWDIGAYEYPGADVIAPSAPSGLSIQ